MRCEELPFTQNMLRATPHGNSTHSFPSGRVLVITCIHTWIVNGVHVKISANLLYYFIQNNKMNFLLIFGEWNFQQPKTVYLFSRNYQNSHSTAILGYLIGLYGKRAVLSDDAIIFYNFSQGRVGETGRSHPHLTGARRHPSRHYAL